MPEVTVQELWTYPVKGCQGAPAQTIEVTKMGVVGDREFVIWENGHLVDQKADQYVAALAPELDRVAGVLRLRHPEHGFYAHEIRDEGEVREATWVLDEFDTIDQGDQVADWLSVVIGRDVRMVTPGPPWRINFPIPQMARLHEKAKQGFTAASPISLANQASLDDLNERVETPVPMDRFRMNVVVGGLDAFEEDDIDSLSNERVELLQVTPAERCVIITTDQTTGERPPNDLMRTLGRYRMKPKEDRFGSGMIFGNYMTVGREGALSVGDRLAVA